MSLDSEEIIDLLDGSRGRKIEGIHKLTLFLNPHEREENRDEIKRLFYRTMDYSLLGLVPGELTQLWVSTEVDMPAYYGPTVVKRVLTSLVEMSSIQPLKP